MKRSGQIQFLRIEFDIENAIYWLQLLQRTGLFPYDYDMMLNSAEEIKRMLIASLNTSKQKKWDYAPIHASGLAFCFGVLFSFHLSLFTLLWGLTNSISLFSRFSCSCKQQVRIYLVLYSLFFVQANLKREKSAHSVVRPFSLCIYFILNSQANFWVDRKMQQRVCSSWMAFWEKR